MRLLPLAAALLALTTAAATAAPPAEAEPVRAIAILRDGTGKQVGTATLAQDEAGVRIAIGVKGLPPGRHGFHLHASGRCEMPDFASAGPHFNPGKKGHGPSGTAEAHAGDLPELVADADGVAMVGFIAHGVSLAPGPTSLLSGSGTALVLTTGPDDGQAEPSGARLVCGVVTKR
jgi:Cu-Zn family superoxide dismutase